MTEVEFSVYKERLVTRVTALKLEEFYRIPDDLIDKFMSIVPPSKPSDNLFAKDPIDVIENFISENSHGLGASRKGIEIRHL